MSNETDCGILFITHVSRAFNHAPQPCETRLYFSRMYIAVCGGGTLYDFVCLRTSLYHQDIHVNNKINMKTLEIALSHSYRLSLCIPQIG